MELIFTDDEKNIFRKIQPIRNGLIGNGLSSSAIEKIFIKLLAVNSLAESGINPTRGEFEALVDDIENYMKKSFEEFVSYIKETQSGK
ncbi:MAG: hypothetical protein RQ824_10810 [bacterium]|nr:hypothetical protein [bacterium]